MKLTKKQAKAYSMFTWDYKRKTGCTDNEFEFWVNNNKKASKIIRLAFYGGYCDKYRIVDSRTGKEGCRKCPLLKLWGHSCNNENKTDLFMKWANAETKKTRKKYAEIIYQDIKRS